jgi:N-acyl-phosphatidylethanolamine-hydrolysing phospholipase D
MSSKSKKSMDSGLRKFICLFLAGFLFPACALNPPAFDEGKWRAGIMASDLSLLYAPHFQDGRFFNPWMPFQDKGFLQFLRWRFTAGQEYSEEEKDFRPGFRRDAREQILATPYGDFIMWLGHGTFLMRLNGRYWLTDPVFSEKIFFIQRKTPPGMTMAALKEIAPEMSVLISHNHYDHLDNKSILDLPEDTRIYVPLGLKTYVQGMKKEDVTEMDWWQSIDCGNGITLVCLPMQHWSRRIGQGTNETLWASYMLITPSVTIYFGGDTGYFIGYQEIGRRFPAIDYALLPTTAYHPRWFMHYAHMNVDEAIEAFHDLKAGCMIPQQWGTFHLGEEPVGYSILELKKKMAEGKIDPTKVIIPDIGEILRLKGRDPKEIIRKGP